jgi:hypothetical protein
MNLLEEIRAEYDLCINNPHEYQKKVDSISDLFSLIGKQRLKGEYCPVYVVGRYQSTPIVMLGINPGISLKNSPVYMIGKEICSTCKQYVEQKDVIQRSDHKEIVLTCGHVYRLLERDLIYNYKLLTCYLRLTYSQP